MDPDPTISTTTYLLAEWHMTTTEKTCFKCDESKPIHEYYRHPAMSDGHLGKCKSCTKVDTRRNREKHLDRYREYDRMRYRRDDYRQRQLRLLAHSRTYEQRKCHELVGNAIRDGRMIRPEGCWHCGERCKPDAHHSYYDPKRYDDVTWLCRPCHIRAHKMTVN